MAISSYSRKLPKLLIRRMLTGESWPPLPLSSASSLLRSSLFLEGSLVRGLSSHGGASSVFRSRVAGLLRISSISGVFFYSSPSEIDEGQGPAAINYRSILAEDEFHKLADETLHDLQEKFEEYGDSIQIDGFDIDYGNHVLTLKLGNLGTYVINKQTPNRQIWMSSPVSGPSRFDWDATSRAWVYRRTKANLLQLLEDEFQNLCGEPITLS